MAEPSEEVTNSPTSWVNEHLSRYLESDGEQGHEWRPGVPTLLLTVRGRKSGKLRRTALIYGRDGDRYVLVASQGGDDRHPAWYLNLLEDPMVDVQVRAERFSARARPASPAEKPALWRLMNGIWPHYDEYQAKTEREIPVVIIEPEPSAES